MTLLQVITGIPRTDKEPSCSWKTTPSLVCSNKLPQKERHFLKEPGLAKEIFQHMIKILGEYSMLQILT